MHRILMLLCIQSYLVVGNHVAIVSKPKRLTPRELWEEGGLWLLNKCDQLQFKFPDVLSDALSFVNRESLRVYALRGRGSNGGKALHCLMISPMVYNSSVNNVTPHAPQDASQSAAQEFEGGREASKTSRRLCRRRRRRKRAGGARRYGSGWYRHRQEQQHQQHQ